MIRRIKKLVPETHPLRLIWHKSRALLAAFHAGFPARKLVIIGITGTDGKTTTVAMTAHILSSVGYKTAALSTACIRINDSIEWNPTQKTSPSPWYIQRFLRRAVNAGCTHVVLECSSHGLLQGRLDWVRPIVGAITNISEEHLDYHGTMEAYMDAKAILLKRVARNGGTIILNADDRSYPHYVQIPCQHRIFITTKDDVPAHMRPDDRVLHLTHQHEDEHGISATVIMKNNAQGWKLTLPMAGRFNLSNAATALSCALALNIDASRATASLAAFRGVPGRMEEIDVGQTMRVLIDFTVTPQAYTATLPTLRASLQPGKRLLVLTGSCGDRMKEKRPIVGALCATFADVIVVTNEDPYTEDPEKIMQEVLKGLPPTVPVLDPNSNVQRHTDAGTFAVKISDRRDAIRWILRHAKDGDIVLFAGKGADVTMMTSKGQVPWIEREIVTEELRSMLG